MKKIFFKLLWILGWIFVPFVPIGILVYRRYDKKYKKESAMLITGIVVIVTFITWIMFWNYFDSEDQLKDNPTNQAEKVNLAQETEEVKEVLEKKEVEEIKEITSDQLIQAYDENEIAADKIYKNKRYRITGKVNSISEVLSSLSVTLTKLTNDFNFTYINLQLKDSDKEKVSKLKKEEEITIEGTILGLGWDIDVKDVKFIE